MFRPLTPPTRPARHGTILIVVLALLALFAVVGIGFVFYADGQATSARIYREASSRADVGPPDSADAVNRFFTSLVFGTGDTSTDDLFNALRGHDLMRPMYSGIPGSTTPYSGVGTIHETLGAPFNFDRVYWVNHTVMNIGNTAYVMDPEWAGGPRAGGPTGTPPTIAAPQGRTFIPKNAPYTYPDANNLYLAAPSPATGDVVVPSFYRSWMFNTGNTTADTRLGPPTTYTQNTDWINPEGRPKILRPRPVDQLTQAEIAGRTGTALAAFVDQKIRDGDLFPYPAVNADRSTYTGDVQNLMGAVGMQKNDSIWIDIGLPPRMWNGRLVKPLVAALIVDQDGRLNLNAHGNIKYNGHSSYAGYGPWEVNLAPGLDGSATDANGIVSGRYGATGFLKSRDGLTDRMYSPPPTRLPLYAQVNWDGGPGTAPVMVPPSVGPTQFQTVPGYGVPPFDDNSNAGKGNRHPSLYSPFDWPAAPNGNDGRSYPTRDLRRLNLRYAGPSELYTGMDLAKIPAPPTKGLIGQPSVYSGNNYRLDPAHKNRLLFTTLGVGFDRPGVVGNYNAIEFGKALQLNPPPTTVTYPYPHQPVHPRDPLGNPTYPGTFPSNGGSGIIADFAGAGDFRNRRAIGPVDLNRRLAPYGDPNLPPAPNNMGNAAAAGADRQNLARDVFARLIVATGGAAVVDPSNGNVTLPQPDGMGGYVLTIMTANGPQQIPVGPAEYNALRYLAQLAANIVDYVDQEDVSTVFLWNPPGTGLLVPYDQATLQAAATVVMPNPAEIQNRVVFGVEKPRLVLNEVYSEIANGPGENGMGMNLKDFEVRFWVELVNPTSTPYGVDPMTMQPATGPLGDGSAQLFQPSGNFSPYRIQIFRNTAGTGAANGNLTRPNNVAGDPEVPPQILFDFRQSEAFTDQTKQKVMPNNGAYDPAMNPLGGVAVVGPAINPPANPAEFNPAAGGKVAPPWDKMIQSTAPPGGKQPENSMAYTITPQGIADLRTNPAVRQHMVVLQRLANPYLPESATNPYVTVDYMDGVWSFDAVRFANAKGGGGGGGMGKGIPPRGPNAGGVMNDPTGYDAMNTRFAIGKIQPHAGLSTSTVAATAATPPTYTYPNSCVLDQRPANYDPMTAAEPKHTFGRHNGTTATTPGGATTPAPGGETLLSPYQWFVHFDRGLANQLELLSVQSCKPHEVTQFFLQPNGTGGVRNDLGQAPWLGVNPTNNQPGLDTTTLTHNGLFRALDLLRIKPWDYGPGLGGRVAGRVNINTIQDVRVLQGLLDPQGANLFNATDVNNLWGTTGSFITTRTATMQAKTAADGTTSFQVPVPGPTIDDDPASGTDRPFKPFGAAEFAPDSTGNTTYAARKGSGLQDTLLRVNTTGGNIPYLWLNSQTDPYLRAEMARKLMNNVTTVSNAFSVWMTVGFFEVRRDANGPVYIQEANGFSRPALGREAYLDVPGDLRQQFFAVVDRTAVGLVPGETNATLSVGQPPAFTSLSSFTPGAAGTATIKLANAVPSPALPNPPTQVLVYADGQPVSIAVGTRLVIGVGASQDVVSVTSVNLDGSLNVASYPVLAPPTPLHPHEAGEMVSTVLPGHPGPNPSGFDPRRTNQSIVTAFARLR